MIKIMTIGEVVEYINNSNYIEPCNHFSIRGDDYTPVKKFRKSKYHGDDCAEHTLSGTSAIVITYPSADYIQQAIDIAEKYGKKVFLLEGEIYNAGDIDCDPCEILVGGHKIVAEIKK